MYNLRDDILFSKKKANLKNVIKNLICFKSSNDLKTQN